MIKNRFFAIVSVLFFIVSCSNHKRNSEMVILKSDLERVGLNGSVEEYQQVIYNVIVDSLTDEIKLGDIVSVEELDLVELIVSLRRTYNKFGYIIKDDFMGIDQTPYRTIINEYNDENLVIRKKEFQNNEEIAEEEIIYDKYNQIKERRRNSKDTKVTMLFKHASTQKDNIITTIITTSVQNIPILGRDFKVVTEADSINVFKTVSYEKDKVIVESFMQRDEKNRKKQFKILREENSIIQDYKYIDFDEQGNYIKFYIYIRKDEKEHLDESKPTYIGTVDYKYFE